MHQLRVPTPPITFLQPQRLLLLVWHARALHPARDILPHKPCSSCDRYARLLRLVYAKRHRRQAALH